MSLDGSRRFGPRSVLLAGVAAVSSAAVLTRLAQQEGVPSTVIAWARLGVAAAVLTPLVLRRHGDDLRRLDRPAAILCLASGLALAFHFVTWIHSLEYTSVLASVTLVSASPLFVALFSRPLLGERIGGRLALSLLLAFAGAAAVAAAADPGRAPLQALPQTGNLLALAGAAAMACYLMIGRRIRPRLPVLPYIWLVYLAAALALTPALLLVPAPAAGFSAAAWLCLLALGLVPQLLGHSSYNYALGYLPAALVGLATLGEPVGSALLALLVLGEAPGPLSVAGTALILVGIGITVAAPGPAGGG